MMLLRRGTCPQQEDAKGVRKRKARLKMIEEGEAIMAIALSIEIKQLLERANFAHLASQSQPLGRPLLRQAK